MSSTPWRLLPFSSGRSATSAQSTSYSHIVSGCSRWLNPCVHSDTAVIMSSARYSVGSPLRLKRPPVIAAPSPETGEKDQAGSWPRRSEEHTSELQSLMRSSYAVFCLNKKKKQHNKSEGI